MRRFLPIVLAIGVALLFAESALAAPTNASASPYVTEYTLPTPNAGPLAVVVDARGRVWFAENNVSRIALFDPQTRVFHEFQVPVEAGRLEAWSAVFDDQGVLWFTDGTGNSLWSFNPATETFRRYRLPNNNSFPLIAVPGSGGEIWFTELFGNRLGLVKRTSESEYVLREYSLPAKLSQDYPFGAGPAGLTIDSEGRIWFVETYTGLIGVFDPRRETFQELALPQRLFALTGVAVDGSGRLWLAEHGGSRIAVFHPQTGFFEAYANPPSQPFPTIYLPYWIHLDTKGRVWWNEHIGNKLSMLDPVNKIIVSYPLPTRPVPPLFWPSPLQFTIASDGRIWFTEFLGNKIGVVEPSAAPPFELFAADTVVVRRPQDSLGNVVYVPLKATAKEGKFPLALNASFSLSPVASSGSVVRLALTPPSLTLRGGSEGNAELAVFVAGKMQSSGFTLTVSASDDRLVYSRVITITVEDSGRGFQLPALETAAAALTAFIATYWFVKRRKS